MICHLHNITRHPGLGSIAFVCFCSFSNAALEARQLVKAFQCFAPDYYVLVAKVWWKKFGCATWLVLCELTRGSPEPNYLWRYLKLRGVRSKDVQVCVVIP